MQERPEAYNLLVARRQASVAPELPGTYSGLKRWDTHARRALARPRLLLGDEALAHWYAYIRNFITIFEEILDEAEFTGLDEHLEVFPYRNLEV